MRCDYLQKKLKLKVLANDCFLFKSYFEKLREIATDDTRDYDCTVVKVEAAHGKQVRKILRVPYPPVFFIRLARHK